MFNIIAVSTVFLAAVSSVSGLTVARRTTPAGYDEGYLEPYATYHTRYIALGCQNKHSVPFFNECCHPLLKTENLVTARPAHCSPSPSASSSAAAAAPTTNVGTPADGDDDLPFCDEDDDDKSTSAPPAAAPTPSQAAPAAQANPTPAPAASPVSAASPSPEAVKPAPTQAADNSQSTPASTGGEVFKGGFATFFFQNGIAGACGTVHQDSDRVIAMDSRMYGDTGRQSQFCGKNIEITNPANGHKVTAVVADACPTCDNDKSLDLSVGAFNELADASVGHMAIEWRFV